MKHIIFENTLFKNLIISCFIIFISSTIKRLIKIITNNKIAKINLLNPEFSGYSLNIFELSKPIINFSPGPTQFPKVLLEEIKEEFINSTNGITPLELSHRSPEFVNILSSVNENMKKLMKIPDDFKILWMHGGGHGQFGAIPMNLKHLITNNKYANYIVSGTWSNRAYEEACKVINTYNSFNNDILPLNHKSITMDCLNISNNDAYVYFCSNETVNGIEFKKDGIPYPDRNMLKTARSIIDMSSDFTMKNIDWTCVDVAFACTSKNLGIPGATIVIIRNDILDELYNNNNYIPSVLDWKIYNNTNSLYNTPAVYNIYIVNKYLNYYIERGGIDILEKESKIKSSIIYEFIDNSSLYKCLIIDKLSRSNINIPFFVGDGNREIRSKFLHFCYMNNIVGLRTKTPFRYCDYNMVEPLRINLYNGISIEESLKLVDVMKQFEVLLH
tara:strand:+ start:1399 stop:2730 length:1332 start_codon:yes stop_codon:yes gene_type:complete